MINTGDPVFCTVISRSYLKYAAALHSAILKFHPGAKLFALVVDVHSRDVIEESFGTSITILPMDAVPVDGIQDMVVYYDAYELISALKPSLMTYLFRKYGVEKLIYLDADIFVTNGFSTALNLLDSYDLLFTPHVTMPLPRDGKLPDDLEIADSGVYNGGFWAMRRTPNLLLMLDWLIERLRDECFFWTERRMFCDQKFLPLLAHFCGSRFHCLSDPGYNIAYWNLQERHLERLGGSFLSNGKPAVFFHLSGYSSDSPTIFTKHTDRFTTQNYPIISDVLQEYKKLHDNIPFSSVKGYGYQTYRGVVLNTPLRRYYFQNRFFSDLSISDDTIFQNGLMHYHAGKLTEAVSAWRWLSERNPQHFAALSNLSVCLIRLGDWTGAVDANRRVLVLDSRNEQALYNLGQALYQIGKFQEAEEAWKGLILINPSHAHAQASLTHLKTTSVARSSPASE